MRIFNGVDELKAAVGEDLGYSEWHEVTQESVNLFADATGDHQWIHVDVERAKAGPFGGTIQHGYMTLSLIPMLVGQIYKTEGVKMGVNYGCNKVRFPNPVLVGSKVRASAKIASVEPSSLGFTVTAVVTIEIEGAAKPACVAETLSVVVP
jgi:acyl dehydratase